MEKIKMLTPLVEMDGDEMTRIIWKMISRIVAMSFCEPRSCGLGLSS